MPRFAAEGAKVLGELSGGENPSGARVEKTHPVRGVSRCQLVQFCKRWLHGPECSASFRVRHAIVLDAPKPRRGGRGFSLASCFTSVRRWGKANVQRLLLSLVLVVLVVQEVFEVVVLRSGAHDEPPVDRSTDDRDEDFLAA